MKFKSMKLLLKLNYIIFFQHVNSKKSGVLNQLYDNTHHIYPKLEGPFLSKGGI